jgi:hypothetical protein
MDAVPKKVKWADMQDDDPMPVWPEPEPEPEVIVSKHGIKIRTQDKTKPLVKGK